MRVFPGSGIFPKLTCLRDFENDLADIQAFEKHFAKAEAIIILHDNLQKERQDLSENAYYLGESYLYFQEKIKNVTTEFESAKEVLKQTITRIEQLKETQYKEERKLDKVIIVLQKDLERAKKQQSYWASINKLSLIHI